MDNFVEFSAGGETYKAYTTLDNLFRIEASGLNLTEIGTGGTPSFTDTKAILSAALRADIPDVKKRTAFINAYLDKNRFKACHATLEYVIACLTSPEDKEVVEAEKKTLAS